MGRLRRHRLVVAGVVLVLAAALAGGGFLLFGTPDYGERVSGPHGEYPDALADGMPQPPLTVLGQADDPQILDGLRLELGDDVTASTVRADTEYWRYGRDGYTPSRIATATDAVYVLWDDGLLVQLDPQTAESQWQVETGQDELSAVRVVGSVVAVVADTRVRAYRAEDGAEAWTSDAPPQCRGDVDLGDAVVTGTALAIETTCSDGPNGVTLLDQHDQHTWITDAGTPRVFGVGDGRFGVTSLFAGVSIHSANTGKRVTRVPEPTEDVTYWDGAGDYFVARNSGARNPDDLAYAAWDQTANEWAWRVRTDGTWHPAGIPIIAGDLVYTVRYHPDETQHRSVVAHDLATGKRRWHTEIDLSRYVTVDDPALFSELELSISDISAGAVVVTVGEPGARTSAHCDRCSVILGEQ